MFLDLIRQNVKIVWRVKKIPVMFELVALRASFVKNIFRYGIIEISGNKVNTLCDDVVDGQKCLITPRIP